MQITIWDIRPRSITIDGNALTEDARRLIKMADGDLSSAHGDDLNPVIVVRRRPIGIDQAAKHLGYSGEVAQKHTKFFGDEPAIERHALRPTQLRAAEDVNALAAVPGIGVRIGHNDQWLSDEIPNESIERGATRWAHVLSGYQRIIARQRQSAQ